MPGGDAVSFAEAIWLAALIPAGEHGAESDSVSGDHSGPAAERKVRGADTADGPAKLYDATPAGGPGITVTQATVDPGRALPHALDIARSLKPLKRQRTGRRGLELDLDATVEAYARTHKLIPSFGPALERWFDAVVIVDISPSMELWQQAVGEFIRMLDHTGAFRTVHRWNLHPSDDGVTIRNSAGRRATPREAISSDGRRLTFLLSDCTADAWREDEIWSVARSWATSGPTVLISPLPPRLWRRTGMNRPAARVRARTPGCSSSGLSYEPAGQAAEQLGSGSIPITVASLDATSTAAWASMLMCTGTGGCDAILVPKAQTPDSGGEPAIEERPPIEKRINDFLATASDNAVKLATLCSPFSRVSFPLLTLLGRSIDRGVDTTQIAEVVLSGLFTVKPRDDGWTSLHMHDDAKTVLAERLSKRDARRSFELLSRSIEAHGNPGRGFLIAVQSSRGTETVPANIEPFAEASESLQAVLAGASEVRGRTRVIGSGVDRPVSTSRTVPTSPLTQVSRPVPAGEPEAAAFGPSFFLSYSRSVPLRGDRSDPDYWVKRFFHDLAAEIRSLDSYLRQGFIADHVPPGSSPEILTAQNLANCRTFVPLYGDDYFDDEQCGREWAVFERRRQLGRDRTGYDGESILPVLWTRPGRQDWPEVAHRFRPNPLLSNDLYLRLGLFELIRLHERAYHEVVRLLAKEIVRKARTEAPPVAGEDALSFASPTFPTPGRSTRHIYITVAAGIRRTLPTERNPDYYGERPEDWRPYLPESHEPIALRAARIARSLGYQPEIRVLTATSPETKMSSPQTPSASQVQQPPAASIVLADPWLFRGYRERRNLEVVDLRRKEWVRLLVPWCAADQETAQQRTILESHVSNAVPWMTQSWRRTCPQHLADLSTVQEFDDALPMVIDRARDHFLNNINMRPLRDSALGGYAGRPRLAPPPEDEPPRNGLG